MINGCQIVEDCTNGDATERRSAYAKASAYAEATAAALCASAIAKAFADKMADKYEIGGEGVVLMVGHLIGFWPTR